MIRNFRRAWKRGMVTMMAVLMGIFACPVATAAPIETVSTISPLSIMTVSNPAIITTLPMVLLPLNSMLDASAKAVVETPVETPIVEEEVLAAEETTVTPEPVAVEEEPVVEEVPITYDYSAIPMPKQDLDSVLTACDQNKIPVPVILAVIEHESRFQSNAVNKSSGCYGYMQLHPRYFPKNLSPSENIRYGVEYLASNLAKCNGNMVQALDMYSAGHVTGSTKYANTILAMAAEWSAVTGLPM